MSGSVPLTWETARPLVPELALIAATIAYGATFKLVQNALDDVTPVGFILLRFSMGAVVLLPIAIRNGWRGPSTAREGLRFKDFLLAVLAFGVVGFAGYWFQNAGLERTTTSNSAFITGLFVVFTPLLQTVVTRRRPSLNVVIAVAFAVVGLFLLEGSTFRLHSGDALTLACAFCFGLWILIGSYFTQHFDPIALTAGQLVVFSVLAAPVVAVSGLGRVTAQVLVAAAITGVCCSALAFTLQLWGLRFVEPSRAAVILTFEPVVAGIIGFWVGERLGVSGYIGAAVILSGIVVAESRSWWAGRLV
ncbi:MAG TPA: DMT family transporter [Acidimicrobiia bacterium]|nr:DMT family transporter [Acidimicrobiia bacterium]